MYAKTMLQPLPRECSLPFDEQTKNLKARYSVAAFEKHPLLPPYTSEEVCAMEAKYSFTFPPLLRFYIENISRETSFTFYRSIVHPRDCKVHPRDCKGYKESNTWLSHESTNGCTSDELIWFSGRLRGYVELKNGSFSYTMTLYERMMRADPKDGWIGGNERRRSLPTIGDSLRKWQTFEDSLRKWQTCENGFMWNTPQVMQNLELPENLKECRRDKYRAMEVIKGHIKIQRIVEYYRVASRAARMIQRRWQIAVADPNYRIAKKRLLREFEELSLSAL